MSVTVLDRSNLTENAALNTFLKCSSLRSLSVPYTCTFLFVYPKCPVMRSLLGYFSLVLYISSWSCLMVMTPLDC